MYTWLVPLKHLGPFMFFLAQPKHGKAANQLSETETDPWFHIFLKKHEALCNKNGMKPLSGQITRFKYATWECNQ